MPYGIAKKLGGDSPKNVRWMEDCVAALRKKGHDTVSAVRICKKMHERMKVGEKNER